MFHRQSSRLKRFDTPDFWERNGSSSPCISVEVPPVQMPQMQQAPMQSGSCMSGSPRAMGPSMSTLPVPMGMAPRSTLTLPLTPVMILQPMMQTGVLSPTGHVWHQQQLTVPGSPTPSPNRRSPRKSPTNSPAASRGARSSEDGQQPSSPILLGRTVKAREAASSSSLMPGTMVHEFAQDGWHKIRWCIDGKKLAGHDTKVLSPEFQLNLPEQGHKPFRIMVLATETSGRGGCSFRKAGGRGRIVLKCESTCEGPSLVQFRTGLSTGAKAQPMRGPTSHDFCEQSCCCGEDWNLRAAVFKDSQRFEVYLEVDPATPMVENANL